MSATTWKSRWAEIEWRLSRAAHSDVVLPMLALLASMYIGWKWTLAISMGPVSLFFILLLLGITVSSPFGVLLGFVVVLFTRPAEFFPDIVAYQPAKVFAICSTILLLLAKMMNRDLTLAASGFNKWMYAFAIGVANSVIFSSDPTSSLRFFAEVFVKIVILWVLIINLIETRQRAVQFQVLIAILTATISTYVIWGKITGAVAVEGSRSSFVGYLGDPNDLAMCLLISIGFVGEAVAGNRGLKRLFFLVLFICLMGGLISTQSRGGLLGLGAAVYVMMWRRTRSHVFTGGICGVALVGLVAVSGINDRQTVSSESGVIDSSSMGRLDAWKAGARMLVKNPFHGVGLNQVVLNYGSYAINPVSWRPKTSHNMYVQCAAETGFPGIIPFLMLCLSTLWVNWRLMWEVPAKATATERAFLYGQLPNALGMLVASFFLSVAWYWFPYIVFAQAATSDRVWLKLDDSEGRRRGPRVPNLKFFHRG